MLSMKPQMLGGCLISAPLRAEYRKILTPEALEFVAHLSRRFAPRAEELLEARRKRQLRFDAGEKPDFLPHTRHIREGSWRVASIPADIQDRRVEITGPTDRKMVINALNSGASVYMSDFEDSNCPTWDNMVAGQVNLFDAVRRTATLEQGGKTYKLAAKTAVLFVRPRGWHLWEKHVVVEGRFVPGGVFDFALYFFHNAKELLARGSGPYFYLPKMESHLEARLWNDIFMEAQLYCGVAPGTVRATCLIETLPAAFEMDEILYELREHSAGLNCGRWDYMFSFVKTLRLDASRIFPDRNGVGMDQHFLRSYAQLLIKTCHRRGAHAMGGMSAVIPVKGDAGANKAAFDKVKGDKLREVSDGHDGSWVAHPGLVGLAREVFDAHMRSANQIATKPRAEVRVSAEDLLRVPTGPRTVAALRNNISVGVSYLSAWLGGNGCVPLHNLMEDAATAEISRAQVWQWLRHGVSLDDGAPLTRDKVALVLLEEEDSLRRELGDARFATGHWLEALALFRTMIFAQELPAFLTLPAYDSLVAAEFAAEIAGAPHVARL
ncbi:malate synthase [Helicosporidium sp. ATCC 50920]|nr:malate synthase [Helicosporidium sp. ATCC 50920]|eukprot:KDD74227.1 malate synthase [Helicosporidium sp. ATCC 50920]